MMVGVRWIGITLALASAIVLTACTGQSAESKKPDAQSDQTGMRESIQTDGLRDLAQSHIDSNVPPPELFDKLLKRDVLKYLDNLGYKGSEVQFEFLRVGPTQTGISYPKYYVWVELSNKNKMEVEGAARLAAMGKKEFQVTDFIPKNSIGKYGSGLESTFPLPVIDEIKKRL